jgi:septal ring factor EnvC (AmiA/AmiB activator)
VVEQEKCRQTQLHYEKLERSLKEQREEAEMRWREPKDEASGEQLKHEVKEREKDIDRLHAKIGDQKRELTQLEDHLAEANSEAQALRSSLARLEAAHESLEIQHRITTTNLDAQIANLRRERQEEVLSLMEDNSSQKLRLTDLSEKYE